MFSPAANLRNKIRSLKESLKINEDWLAQIIRDCEHQYGPVIESQRRIYPVIGSMFFQNIEQWERTCNKCGKVQTTDHYKETIIREPDFGR